ncbi:MAG: hypothetical protein PVI37_01615 [Gammaproteobacteria bacterium]|jgi:photosystem II stability/assembly factor-like uncharacterized protein
MSFRPRLLLVLFVFLGAPVASASQPPASLYQGLQWRLVGPFRGGWATMAAGIPDQPNTFYFGAADGGIWKTTNAGRTWQPLMQHEKSATVGALAIAPSNPEVIYVGTGQVAARYDSAAGNGMYRSDDGGRTWTHIGLANTRHIGRILVDPDNPEHVLVAALGHMFGANTARGIYRSTDGGRHWKKALYVNADTGFVDLARDPAHPEVVYAAAWQMRMHPWLDYYMTQAGPGSGIYKSTDGGATWTKVAGKGLPAGSLGRVGLAVARGSEARRIYATVVAASGRSGFYRSDDGGATWTLENADPELASDYFGRVTAAPDDRDTVYVVGRSIHKSTDGGAHFTIVKGSPGGDDYHFLWINPAAPDHMVTAADQGCVVTVDGGRSWSSWYNQPTAQFYHVATDDRFPYWIYGGQQDSGTVAIRSRGPDGVIGPREWHPVGGDERDFDIPRPGDPETVFGSGLGGYVSRWDATTHQVTDVSPWPVSSYGADPRKVKYRYTWITPIAFGTEDAHPLYFGAQSLFRSNDDGAHWESASPDLTGQTREGVDCEPADLSAATACGFGVIYAIAPSPKRPDTLWVGTDNGRIELSTDRGGHWKNVTPKAMPEWGRIDSIAPSPFDAEGAYVAVDTHRLDDHRPVMFRTDDGGKHWKSITHGLPADEYVASVAADPVRRGLVFAGTNRSVYVSFDAGGHWQPLGLNLPTTSVRDLTVHGDDLVAATMGRGFWSLDDIAPLRELSAQTAREPAHLFTPAVAIRMRSDANRDTPPPPSEPKAHNPPTGAVIDYWLAGPADGPVTLTFTDANGRVVRRFSSEQETGELPAQRYFEEEWAGREPRLEGGAGMHRFVWNLRYPRPPAIEYQYSISAVFPGDTPLVPQGAFAVPGHYTVTLSVGGHDYTAPLEIRMDPRVKVSNDALAGQLAFENRISATLQRAVTAYRESGELLERLEKRGASPDTIKALKNLRTDGGDSFKSIADALDDVAARLELSDAAPTQGQKAVFHAYKQRLENTLKRMNGLQAVE